MIKLFNIPHNVVDTSQFNNLLFDDCFALCDGHKNE